MNQKGFAPIIGLLVFILIVGVISLLVFKNFFPQGGVRTSSNVQQNVDANDCSASGQTASKKDSITHTKFTSQVSIIDLLKETPSEVIARVLSTDPFIIEVFDKNNILTSTVDDLGIREDLFVADSEKGVITSLAFNDIVSAKFFGFSYASGELAAGTGIKDIKKITGDIRYFHPNQNPLFSRSGVLIRYTPITSNSNEFLLIFHDGKVYYRDNNNNTFSNRTLNSVDLTDLLKEFSSVHFDDTPSDFTVSLYGPSLVLTCNRYQKIKLDKNSSSIDRLIARLNTIIDSFKTNAAYTLTYQKKYRIKDWQYSDLVPLREANSLAFRQKNKERLSKIKPPEELVKEIDSLTTYYQSENTMYGVYFGACIDGSRGTWGCFGAEEKAFKQWPQELSIKLKDIPKEGMTISKEEYLAHKDFYDSLFTQFSYVLFREDDYLYESLYISLK